MLYIRTDMNSVIATGHVMRCLSIADAARQFFGDKIMFVLSDESGVPLISGRGYDTLVLHSDWEDLADGIDEFLEVLAPGDVVLVDSYSKSRNFMTAVREKAYVMYIDDINEEIHPVDGLLCYEPYYESLNFDVIYPGIDLLLGTAYVPLRAEFENCGEKRISGEIEKILVLSGGSDYFRAIPQILESLDQCFAGEVYAICGTYSAHYESLCAMYADRKNVHILKTVENLKEYMELCDVAVTAGGSTMYELCAVGTPAISYSFADNQLLNVQTLDKMGIAPYAGDFRNADVPANLREELSKMQDSAVRRAFSQKMQQLVDGKGASRIAEHLAHCSLR